MKIEITAPSKTFLLGEYLALTGGPALLLNTAPRFKLIVDDEKPDTKINYQNIDKNCPAGKFIEDNSEIFADKKLTFIDPYEGIGGFGASSAQYCMVAAIKNYILHKNPSINNMLAEYQAYAANGINYKPSGADFVSQMKGGITYFNRNANLIEKYIWPFPNLAFCLVHSGNKIATHQHISTLGQIDVTNLEEIVLAGVASLVKHDLKGFCTAINQYGEILLEKGLVCENTVNLLNLLKSNQQVLAAKGCGALGADVICVLLPINIKEAFLDWASKLNLHVTLIDNQTSDGVAIKKTESNEQIKRVITVDKNDQQIGISEKIEAHRKGILHRAFSVFVFRSHQGIIEVLLQQRALHKYHCAGMWSNTCCSHPDPGEDTAICVQKRLQEEMGITCPLYEIGAFRYKAEVGNGLVEHEIDHIFIGEYANDKLSPDPEEVNNYRWIALDKLLADIEKHPAMYTPWLYQALQLIIRQNALYEYFGFTEV